MDLKTLFGSNWRKFVLKQLFSYLQNTDLITRIENNVTRTQKVAIMLYLVACHHEKEEEEDRHQEQI